MVVPPLLGSPSVPALVILIVASVCLSAVTSARGVISPPEVPASVSVDLLLDLLPASSELLDSLVQKLPSGTVLFASSLLLFVVAFSTGRVGMKVGMLVSGSSDSHEELLVLPSGVDVFSSKLNLPSSLAAERAVFTNCWRDRYLSPIARLYLGFAPLTAFTFWRYVSQ